MRRGLLAAAAFLILLAGGYLALRDSSTFAVRDVEVRGATGPDAAKIELALRDAARAMTTLNADAAELAKAVGRYPTVKGVEVDRDLPHGLAVRVLEKRAVATVTRGGRKIPLASDGRLLDGATPPSDVPALQVEGATGTRVSDTRGRQLVELVAAAPSALRRRATEATVTDLGLTLEMKDGPRLYFGTADDLNAKWTAVARVLADPAAEGATYLDVRVPERVAAGGLGELAADEQEAETQTESGVPAAPEAAPSTSTGA